MIRDTETQITSVWGKWKGMGLGRQRISRNKFDFFVDGLRQVGLQGSKHQRGGRVTVTAWDVTVGWGSSSVATASDRHAAEAGSIPRCQGIFLPGSTFSADSLVVSVHPRVQLHA